MVDRKTLKEKAEGLGDVLVRIGEALKDDPSLLLDQEWKHELAKSILEPGKTTNFYNESAITAAIGNWDSWLALALEYRATET
jgi:hypothetical protein